MLHHIFPHHTPYSLVMDLDSNRVLIAFRIVTMMYLYLWKSGKKMFNVL